MNNFPRYESYKDSGIEWLGEIPEHWEIKRLKFEVTYQKGKNPKEIILDETENIYLSMDYLRGSFQKIQYVKKIDGLMTVKSDDILLLWDGANAGEFIKGKDGVLSSTMAVVQISNCNKGFSWFYLKTLERKLRETTVGMGIPHVSSDELNNLSFLLPTPSEQTAIAEFLDHKTAQIAHAIDQKEMLIELLQERRQILIHNAVTCGLNPNVKMKHSGIDCIGKIPEHWEVASNYALFEERNEAGNENLPILMVSIHTAVSSEEISDEENIRGKVRIEDKTSYKLVKPNDIAFNMMRAWQGAIGEVRTEGMVSPAYIVAKPKREFSSHYLEFQFRTQDYIQQIDRFSKGITDFRKRLYWNEFKRLKTVLPPLEEQKQISEFIENLNTKIETAISCKQKEIEKLKEYKVVLINNAVTGKIKVI